MSKIKDLLNDENSVLAFDIDGVLAIMEWGVYNHYQLMNDDWNELCRKGVNEYTEKLVSKKIQSFLLKKNMNNIYVVTKVGTDNEILFKEEFANKFYNIPKQNVHCVRDNSDKKIALQKIKQKYPELQDYQIVMIDDTTDILNDIMNNTNYSTVHISSFLDI